MPDSTTPATAALASMQRRYPAIIVIELPAATAEEYAWAYDQIGRAATENWPIERRMHGSVDEAVIAHVLHEFYDDQGDGDL